MKHDITYPSSDGKTQIHAIIWEPEDAPKAVLQICHGMVDYADRYDDFAQHAAAQATMSLQTIISDMVLPSSQTISTDTLRIRMATNVSSQISIPCAL